MDEGGQGHKNRRTGTEAEKREGDARILKYKRPPCTLLLLDPLLTLVRIVLSLPLVHWLWFFPPWNLFFSLVFFSLLSLDSAFKLSKTAGV